jgi:hypothetical protein
MLPHVVAVSLAQKFDTIPIAVSSRIRTQIAPTGVWYPHWYSIFCAVENKRTPKWLRILLDSGQGTRSFAAARWISARQARLATAKADSRA